MNAKRFYKEHKPVIIETMRASTQKNVRYPVDQIKSSGSFCSATYQNLSFA